LRSFTYFCLNAQWYFLGSGVVNIKNQFHEKLFLFFCSFL
jgi:hypothetical protein